VNSVQDFFHTDWDAMTQHDWLGLVITIVVFIIMIGLYFYILHPSNKERFEAYRHIPLNDDNDVNDEVDHERK